MNRHAIMGYAMAPCLALPSPSHMVTLQAEQRGGFAVARPGPFMRISVPPSEGGTEPEAPIAPLDAAALERGLKAIYDSEMKRLQIERPKLNRRGRKLEARRFALRVEGLLRRRGQIVKEQL